MKELYCFLLAVCIISGYTGFIAGTSYARMHYSAAIKTCNKDNHKGLGFYGYYIKTGICNDNYQFEQGINP